MKKKPKTIEIMQQNQAVSNTQKNTTNNDSNSQFGGFNKIYVQIIEWEDHYSCDKTI